MGTVGQTRHELMRVPDLDHVWETFIRIGPPDTLRSGRHFETLRKRVAPVIAALQADHVIGWYCFLIHGRCSGVPTHVGDRDAFWHIRFEIILPSDHEAVLAALPTHCEMTRHVAHADLQQIAGLTSSKLRTDIGHAWRIIGEQSEWLLGVLSTYRDDLAWDDLWREVGQYLHYYANMTGLQVA